MSLVASMRAGGKAARRPAHGSARRPGAVVLLLALAYAAGLLMFVLGGRVSSSAGVEVPSLRRRRPGSVYRSHLLFDRLWPAMRDDATRAASSLSSAASWRRSMVSAPPPRFFPGPGFSRLAFFYRVFLFALAAGDFGYFSRDYWLLLRWVSSWVLLD
jgi:hypothetical protein